MGSAEIGALRIEGLRNIDHVDIDIRGCAALFSGGNGAGKTTILESIYLLARGKSFRGRKSGELTSVGRERTKVDGVVADAWGGDARQICFVRHHSLMERWINGVVIGDSVGVASGFVVRLVCDGSYRLIEGDPGLRRGFLDLNLFHVEQGAGDLLMRFRRVLAQRNAWLRGGAVGVPIWDAAFVATGAELQEARRRLFRELDTEYRVLASDFWFLGGSRLVLNCGWGEGRTLAEALLADAPGERTAGFTRVGPHRADFSVVGEWGELRLSRGQTKVLVCILQLAFDRVQQQRLGYGSIWLLDDVWAELDSESSRALCGSFFDAGGQYLFTSVGGDAKLRKLDLPSDTRLFHVERGVVTDVS